MDRFIRTPEGLLINLDSFVRINPPVALPRGEDEPANPNGDYVVQGAFKSYGVVTIFQGNADECGAFFAKVAELLCPSTRSHPDDSEGFVITPDEADYLMASLEGIRAMLPAQLSRQALLNYAKAAEILRFPIQSVGLRKEAESAPDARDEIEGGQFIPRAGLSVVTEALALHRSMAECGESPSSASWDVYSRAMRLLGNKSGAEYAEIQAAALRSTSNPNAGKTRGHYGAARGPLMEPTVHILRTGILAGVGCVSEIPLSRLARFETAILAYLNSKRAEKGFDAQQERINAGAKIDAWDLYQALKGVTLTTKQLATYETALNVAEFISSFADGTHPDAEEASKNGE